MRHRGRSTTSRRGWSLANAAAKQFYAEQLQTTAEASIGREFLAKRGFDAAAAAQFGVGYAPKGWDTLVKHLRGQGFSDEELVDCRPRQRRASAARSTGSAAG